MTSPKVPGSGTAANAMSSNAKSSPTTKPFGFGSMIVRTALVFEPEFHEATNWTHWPGLIEERLKSEPTCSPLIENCNVAGLVESEGVTQAEKLYCALLSVAIVSDQT